MLLNNYDIFKDEKHGVYQIRTKSEVMTVEFSGEEEKSIFEEIIEIAKSDSQIELDKLNKQLCKKYKPNKVLFVLNELKDYELLGDKDSSDNEVEYWKQQNGQDDSIKNAQLLILSSGKMAQMLEEKAKLAGLKKIDLIAMEGDLDEAKLKQSFENSDFAIVEADLWNPHYLELINKLALASKKPWLYIRGVNDTSAGVGPIFFGKETGCYSCLQSRLKSQMDLLPYFEEYEKFLRSKKMSSKNENYPVLLYDLIGTIAMIETVKFLTGWAVPEVYGSYLTLDISSYGFRKHSFLKAPFCPTCKPEVEYNLHPWLEPVILATNGNAVH